MVQMLLDAGTDANTQGPGRYSNALQTASSRNHEKYYPTAISLFRWLLRLVGREKSYLYC
jgi:hypothetical protein